MHLVTWYGKLVLNCDLDSILYRLLEVIVFDVITVYEMMVNKYKDKVFDHCTDSIAY